MRKLAAGRLAGTSPLASTAFAESAAFNRCGSLS
jgi:hypothetical protein